MNKRKTTFALAASLLVFASAHIFGVTAQTRANAPKQERLLNGMNVHFWPDATAAKVEARLRIHSGAAFDTVGNEGQTCLTAEALFPNEASRDFFRDDLDGSFEITCNYDYIEISVSSRPDGMLSMLETLSSAVTNPTLDKETVDAVKPAQLAKIEVALKNASMTADSAAAQALFGTFPYGRSPLGTRESLSNVDFADLRFSYERSFGADNATLAVSGNFDQALTFRAARRLLGSWLKSDKKIPATFKQADPPSSKIKLIESPETGVGEIRYAVRGTARNAADNAAFEVLAKVLDGRLKTKAPADKRDLAFVRNESRLLPGMLLFGMSGLNTGIKTDPAENSTAPKTGDPIAQILNEKITDSEFASAKLAVIAERSKISPIILWLDVTTFKLSSVKAEKDAFSLVALDDVQKAANKINALPMAKVMLLSDEAEKEGAQ